METACLRVKFRPLLSNIQQKGSNCRIEIVPEICDQNLSKIKWTAENDSIEYTVPMTYKIIVKKRDNHINDPFDNTYHSCVDLVQTSSDHNVHLQSAYVNKVLSENFILSRLSRNIEYCNDTLNVNYQHLENENKNSQNTYKTSQLIHSNNNTIFNKPIINSESTNESCAGSIGFSYPQDIFQEKNKKQKAIDAATGYELDFSDCNKETIWPPYNDVDTHSTHRHLSLSPICSINTDDYKVKAVECNPSLFYYVYDAQGAASVINKLSSSIDIPNKVSENMKQDLPDIVIRAKEPDRPSIIKPPEVRVAEIVSDMHRQVYPLHKMLNDIFHKCAMLELQWDKNIVKKKIVKTHPYCKYNEKSNSSFDFQMGKKSNRVVYSIVFDG